MSSVTIASGNVVPMTAAVAGDPSTQVGLVSAGAGQGPWIAKQSPNAAVQAVVTGTGAVSATVDVEVSNDGINALDTPAGTITLSGTSIHSDGFTTSNAPWKYIRLNVTAIAGTGAKVTGFLGV